jgi:hypothetical protein
MLLAHIETTHFRYASSWSRYAARFSRDHSTSGFYSPTRFRTSPKISPASAWRLVVSLE